jgi:hypothetical protein
MIEKLCGRFPEHMSRRTKHRDDFFHRLDQLRVTFWSYVGIERLSIGMVELE